MNRERESDLCLNSGYCSLLGNPFLQIRIPSSTPLHANWCRIRWLSVTPLWHVRETNMIISIIQFQNLS